VKLALLALTLACACSSKADKQKGASGCDLSGQYRLRFKARGQKMWFRFNLAKGANSATLQQPMTLELDPKKPKLDIDPDPASCKLTVTAHATVGDILASLTLDPKTNKVTGLVRYSGDRDGLQLTGVRDVGPLTSPNACVKPGTYELVVPAEQEWESDTPKASCDAASLRLPFLVEYVGDDLAIDQLDDKGDAAWGAEDIYTDPAEPCSAEVRFRRFESYAYARLTFAGDSVTADATGVNVEMGEVGARWRCKATQPMAWVERKK